MTQFSKIVILTLATSCLFAKHSISQTRVVVNGNYIVVSGGTSGTPNYMVVDNPAPNAITRSTGHIISEGQYNYVKWNCGTTIGNYTFPFGFSTTSYLPLTLNKTSAGLSNFTASTWRTPGSNNIPWAGLSNVPAVTNMYSGTLGQDASDEAVIDRWWSVIPSGTATADLTFSYRGEENTMTTSPTGLLATQRWTGTVWNDGKGGVSGAKTTTAQNGGITASTVYTATATGLTEFAPFVLISDVVPMSCTPPTVTMSSNLTICNGSSTTVTASGSGTTGPYSYAWTPVGTLSSSNISNPVSNPTTTTTYSCIVTDGAACTNTGTVIVSVNSPPTVAGAGPDQNLCGPTTTLAGNTPAVGTGTWSVISGTASVTTPSSPSSAVTGLVLGAATIRWTISNSPCTPSTDDVVITKNPLPTANAGADVSVCAGDNTTLNGTGNGTFLWSPSIGLSCTTCPSPVSTPTALLTYTLAVTNSCGTATDEISITYPALPSANAGPDVTICSGASTTLSGTGSGTFSWAPSTGLNCTSCANPVADPSSTTNYTLSITATCGAATDVVRVSLAPAITIDSIHSVSACDASDGGIFISAINGTLPYTYLWNPSSVTTQDITGITPDSYSVSVSDAAGCSATIKQNIHVIPPPTPLEICLSTVDSIASAYVHVVWEKPITTLIDSFRIYREVSTVFTKIATVPYAKETIFKDSIPGVDPKNQSHKYKISSINNANVEGPLSNAHETMWLQVTQPSAPAFDLTWTDYCGFPVVIYYIYRDSIHNGDYELIDSAYWGTNVYTDPTPPNDTARYRIESFVATPCTSTGKYPDPAATTVKGSKSNSDNKLGFVSVNDLLNGNWVHIYPNPSTGMFKITSTKFKVKTAEVYDMYGKQIRTSSIEQGMLNLTDVPDGVYFVKVVSNKATAVKKIVISR